MQALKQAFAVCTASALLSIPFAGNAQSSMDHSKMDHGKAETSQTIPSMSDGEVRRVDVETGKITIRHGYIKHLDMPSMTMVFTAKEKGLLTNVKPTQAFCGRTAHATWSLIVKAKATCWKASLFGHDKRMEV